MPKAIAGWRVWSESRTTLVLLIMVVLAAAAVPWTISSPFNLGEFWMAALLASLSIAYSIYAVSSEGARQALNRRTSPAISNMLAIWTFAAAVILPVRLAVAVIAIAAAAQWPVKNLDGKARLYRYVYSTAAVILAAVVANRVMELPVPVAARLAIAAPTYLVVNVSIVALAALASGKMSGLSFFLSPRIHLNEIVTISVGVAEAAMRFSHIPLIWLSLPAAIGIQRLAMRSEVKRTEEQVRKPMTEKVWTMVSREVVKACATVSIVRVDTDDPVAVGGLARMQAGCDAIGTVGKSGLAILLVDCPGNNADSLALRLRSTLLQAKIAGSVAVAAKPRDGQSLEDLLAITEAELITRSAVNRPSESTRSEE
ncbi:MAG: hypothetical protein ACR2N4_19145 [Jatrophihabitans sp.]